MKNAVFFLFFLVVFSAFAEKRDSLVLVKNGKSLFSVYSATNDADNAVVLFQAFIESITGVLPPNENSNSCVLFTADKSFFSAGQCDSLGKDGFIINTKGKSVRIYSENGSGFNNAVYWILEHSLNCRLYAPGAMVIPRTKVLKIAPVNTFQNPAFSFRVNYNGGAFNKDYTAWHGLHNVPQNTTKNFEISDNWGLWVHTLTRLVSPEKYFSSHPEYYALRNGVRVPDQVCLSNPDVLIVVITSLKEEMAKKPNAKYWSVSQMDNFSYCQCDKCRAIDEANHSPSGSVIEFVNKVAEAFPDKIISTLAYQYSRKAPSEVKPRSNVNIMLCSIECDRNRPIAADLSDDGFRSDLESWGKLTGNILVWDYVINFSNILGPFPNLYVLKSNLQLFQENHVNMIFGQGWPNPAGEFTELRCYLLSKLMWNPELSTDSLIHDFCTGYYGPGGKYVEEYIRLSTQKLQESGRALTLYEPMSAHAQGFLSPENIRGYFGLFDKAMETSAGNSLYEHRLEIAMQSLRYAWLEVAQSLPFTPDWIFERNEKGVWVAKPEFVSMLNELCDTAIRYGPVLFHETRNTPEDYRKKMLDYFENGYGSHLAVGKKITFKTPCSPKYAANGTGSLLDGVCGTENYFVLWQGWNGEDVDAVIDMDSVQDLRSVEIHALAVPLSWIFPPESMSIFLSNDGTDFRETGTISNPTASEKPEKAILSYRIEFEKPQRARYIRVVVKNIGKLPPWRGVDGDAWLFLDEIIVH